MSAILKKQRDGQTWRPYWYGKFISDGKQKVVNLNVKWTGTPPASGSLRDGGDTAFEASRARAEVALNAYQEEARTKGRAQHLTEKLIESKTGRAVKYTRIDELAQRWRNLARETEPTELHLTACDMRLNKFVSFMAERNPSAVFLYEVTEADASAYVKQCRTTLAPATAKESVHIVRRAMERFLPVGSSNPFKSFVSRRGNGDKGTIHRRPFTAEELRALLDASRNDEFMFPLVTCAAMTGMRRGDVCKLDWSAVDMAGGMLAVKTSKTEAAVEIPIFPPLREVLEATQSKHNGYVWPKAARMLRDNPDGLTWRFKKLVVSALDKDGPVSACAIRDEAISAILNNVADKERAERMIKAFEMYSDGKNVHEIKGALGCSSSTVSLDLRTIQKLTGKTFIRGGKYSGDAKEAIARLTNEPRKKGQRAASVRDWHALRSTWVTLALSAGVSVEVVKRVTGHQQVEIVLGNYYRPDREQFRAALQGSLPDVLTGGTPQRKELSAGDELAALVAKIQDGSATAKDKKRLRLLAAKV